MAEYIVGSHQKGGVGKSTISWNIAVELQNRGYDVEIIDLDTQQTLYYTNQIRKEDSSLKPLKVTRLKTLKEFKKHISKNEAYQNKIVIVDVGGFDSDIGRVAIASADIVFTPVSHRTFELLGLKTFEKVLASISEAMEETKITHVLLNNLNPQKSKLKGLKNFIERSPHFTLLNSILRTRVDLDYAVADGKNVIEYGAKKKKESKASLEMKALVDEIMNKLELVKD